MQARRRRCLSPRRVLAVAGVVWSVVAAATAVVRAERTVLAIRALDRRFEREVRSVAERSGLPPRAVDHRVLDEQVARLRPYSVVTIHA